MTRFRTNRPALAVLTLVVWMGTSATIGLLSRAATPSSLPQVIQALGNGIAVNIVVNLLVLAAATALFGWKDLGFTAPDWRQLFRLIWFPLLTLAPFPILASVLGLPSDRVLIFLAINTILIALSEEWMFRGILLRALLSRFRLWPSLLATSVLFGTVHVLNAFVFGDLRLAAAQSLAAMMTGMLLVALVLRTGSIWPSIFYHAGWNYGILLIAYESSYDIVPDGPLPLASYAVPMLIVLPNLLYALVILRKVGPVRPSQLG